MAMASKEAGNKGEATSAGKGDEFAMASSNAFPANFDEVVAALPQPQGPQSPMFPSLRLYHGFWLPETLLLSLPQVHAHFKPNPSDVLVASFPKCGTACIKSLCYAAARRAVHSPSRENSGHPLLSRNSHDCVRSLDTLRFLQGDDGGAPRLVGTHLPYSLLPEHTTAADAGCRIVYICRDPKDMLVSLWHFNSGIEYEKGTPPPPASFEDAFEQFCRGCYGVGPQWEHAREYSDASKTRPEKVLFLRYEDMLRDPADSLRKIAAFMGCPFSAAEEEAGVVDAVLELCSMEKQRSLAVNKDGAYVVKGALLFIPDTLPLKVQTFDTAAAISKI